MRSKLALGLGALFFVAAVMIAVPAVGAPQKTASPQKSARSMPGDIVNGKKIYIKFCGKCHTLSAAGARGTLGNNLDHINVTFSCAVSAIENGVGGIQAEYVLRNVTFSQVYDVAKYVSTVSKKGGTPCTAIG
jgi:mono/diheme cytochrome c family protein